MLGQSGSAAGVCDMEVLPGVPERASVAVLSAALIAGWVRIDRDGGRSSCRRAVSSIARNAVSPSVAKISGMVRPTEVSIKVSRSTTGRESSVESSFPTLLLPHPINPVNDIIMVKTV